MGSFRLTNLAVADLRAIGLYTQETWGQAQRDRYLAKLDQAFFLLAQEPQRGRACDDIRADYRKYHVGRHLIFYRQALDGMIDIIRILHDGMDIEAHIDND